jgi:pimeloyl-ACP methyl ester carboxylesterase
MAGVCADAGSYRFHEVLARDGVPLNVVETGNPAGQPLLFLHGFTQSYLCWHAQLDDPELARRFRLVALDLRGHGASGKPWKKSAYAGYKPWAGDVRRVVEALELTRPWIVGWSFGGYVALDYVRAYGQRSIAGLVMTGSHGGLLPRPPASPPRFTGDLDASIRGARDFMALMSVAPPSAEVIDRGLFSHVMLPPYVRNAMAGKRLDNTDLLGSLALPMLVILGEKDLSLPTDTIAQALAHKQNIEIRVYPAVGHSAFIESSQRFNVDLAGFISRVPAH